MGQFSFRRIEVLIILMSKRMYNRIKQKERYFEKN